MCLWKNENHFKHDTCDDDLCKAGMFAVLARQRFVALVGIVLVSKISVHTSFAWLAAQCK